MDNILQASGQCAHVVIINRCSDLSLRYLSFMLVKF